MAIDGFDTPKFALQMHRKIGLPSAPQEVANEHHSETKTSGEEEGRVRS